MRVRFSPRRLLGSLLIVCLAALGTFSIRSSDSVGWAAFANLYSFGDPGAGTSGDSTFGDATNGGGIDSAENHADAAYIVRFNQPPPMASAASARLADEAEVIGIDSPFGPRAYSLSAMAMISNHVVNDAVDGQPLSLTYCDRTNCVRVFTKSGGQGLLRLTGAGLHYGEMYVALDGAMYPHEDAGIPLDEVEFVRTDWKTWRETRPGTLVFDGKQPRT